jgi:transposase
MQVVLARCAGLDVHKKTVVVTVLLTASNGAVTKQARTFSTMTAELLRLEAWLAELQVDHLALESTGVYTPPTMLQSVEGVI